MAYVLYTSVFVLLALTTVLYHTRGRWLHLVPSLPLLRFPGYNRLPGSFEGDVEAGLSSSTFDLSGNVQGGDSRAGLDHASKKEILKIMKKRRMPFDEARRVYMQQRFSDNGIGPDGRPRDPKFVSFS